VTVGSARFSQYVAPPAAANPYASRSLELMPTSLGMVAALCLTDVEGADFIANCQRALRSVQVAPSSLSRALPTSYTAALATVLDTLDATRTAAATQLAQARAAHAQANAAQRLAQVHAVAAAQLRGLAAGPASQANAAIVSALVATSQAYGSLARAAAAGNSQAYATARGSVQRSETALSSAFRQLQPFGYRVG
jgi:hypothetical protein